MRNDSGSPDGLRFPSGSDIVANTSGAFIGALLVLFVWSLRRRRALRMANRPA